MTEKMGQHEGSYLPLFWDSVSYLILILENIEN